MDAEETRRVLIVEDNSSVRRVLVRVFELDGFRVSAASNGEEALELLSSEHFDVMITDITMPKMDGMALIKHLGANGPYIPDCTYVVTSRSEAEERDWVSDYPGISIIEKPVGPRHMLRLVKRDGAEQAREKEEVS